MIISGVGITENNELWYTYGDLAFNSAEKSIGGVTFITDKDNKRIKV
jgi:hypothetical protein